MLASSGAKVQSKGLPALGALATQAGPAVPDAVIVDLRGVDAFPADVALLRRHHPQVGVVIVASQMDPAQMLEAMRAGVNEWLAEPVSPSALAAAVQRVVVQRVTKPVTGQVFAFVGAKG